jgi:hypothetical protein
VDAHFRDLNRAVQGWGNWGGDLVKLAWSPNGPDCLEQGKRMGESYAANPRLYKHLLEAIKDGR